MSEITQVFSALKNKNTLMIGALTGPRSLQVNKFTDQKNRVFVKDPYYDQYIKRYVERFLPSKDLLKHRPIIYKDSIASFSGNYFLDLTHFRSRINYDIKNWLSQLDAEIIDLVRASPSGTVIFGTQVGDPYVQHELQKVEKETKVKVIKSRFTWKIVI